MADNKLFREKSLESVQSPESLNEYLKVTSPTVWLVLAAVAFVLIGAIVWGCLGHLDSTQPVAVVSDGQKTVCLVPENALDAVVSNPEVTVEDETYTLKPDVLKPAAVKEDTNVYVLMAGDLQPGDIVYQIDVAKNMKEGVYKGQVVTEEITPISFLMN